MEFAGVRDSQRGFFSLCHLFCGGKHRPPIPMPRGFKRKHDHETVIHEFTEEEITHVEHTVVVDTVSADGRRVTREEYPLYAPPSPVRPRAQPPSQGLVGPHGTCDDAGFLSWDLPTVPGTVADENESIDGESQSNGKRKNQYFVTTVSDMHNSLRRQSHMFSGAGFVSETVDARPRHAVLT